jgi:type III secretory pathway component EscV
MWRQGDYEASLTELGQITEGVADARTQFVTEMFTEGGAISIEVYGKVRTLLEDRQRNGAGIAAETRRDAGRALLLLARHRREGQSAGPAGEAQRGDSPPMLPLATPITLEAEDGLFPEGQGTPLVARMIETSIPQMRSAIEADVGVRIPGVQIASSVNSELPAGGYVVKLHEIPLASGTVDRGRGEEMIYRGVAPAVRRYLDTYLGFQEVESLVEKWRVSSGDPDASALVAGVLSSSLARLRLVQVLQRLVREEVGISDLGAMLRAVAQTPIGLEVDEVVDRVRKSEALLPKLPGNEAKRRKFGLAPEWEATFERWILEHNGKRVLAIPSNEEHLIDEFVEGITSRASGNSDSPPALVVRDDLRRFVRRLTERWFPALPVLAQSESLGSAVQLEPVPFPSALDQVAS